jgi:ElaB/YqjD/DUF883 family membrane-anchored ribosome-binding protein
LNDCALKSANAKEKIMVGSFDTSRRIDDMQDAAGAVANRMSSVADQVGQRVASTADRVSDKATQALATAKERGAAAADSANEVATTLQDALAQSARNQPITTIALSVAAGFLLGALWRTGQAR